MSNAEKALFPASKAASTASLAGMASVVSTVNTFEPSSKCVITGSVEFQVVLFLPVPKEV